MKHDVQITAALLAFALLLTACSADYADYPETHREYLAYSLGGDLQFTSEYSEMYPDGTRVLHRDVHYMQQTLGTERNFTIDAYQGHNDGRLPRSFTNAQCDDYYLLYAMYPEAAAAALHEFADKKLSREYRVPAFQQELLMHPRTGVYIRADAYCALPISEPEGIPLTEAALSPETGLQVCTASLKSIAQDETVIPIIEIILLDKPGSEEAPKNTERYLELIEQLYEDYLRETEAPVNYRFALVKTVQNSSGIPESEEVLYDRSSLAGVGEFDASERYDTVNYMIGRTMQAELQEILLRRQT